MTTALCDRGHKMYQPLRRAVWLQSATGTGRVIMAVARNSYLMKCSSKANGFTGLRVCGSLLKKKRDHRTCTARHGSRAVLHSCCLRSFSRADRNVLGFGLSAFCEAKLQH